MSSVETGQMSAVETGQMSDAETGQMSAVETRQMLKSQIRAWVSFNQHVLCMSGTGSRSCIGRHARLLAGQRTPKAN